MIVSFNVLVSYFRPLSPLGSHTFSVSPYCSIFQLLYLTPVYYFWKNKNKNHIRGEIEKGLLSKRSQEFLSRGICLKPPPVPRREFSDSVHLYKPGTSEMFKLRTDGKTLTVLSTSIHRSVCRNLRVSTGSMNKVFTGTIDTRADTKFIT